jgi:hypothetical protein
VEERESEKTYERFVEDAISMNKAQFRKKLIEKIEYGEGEKKNK